MHFRVRPWCERWVPALAGLIVLLSSFVPSVSAQVAARGVSTQFSFFDPSAPRRVIPAIPSGPPVRVMPPHTILPPAEYASRKGAGVQPRAPRATQPPLLVYNDAVTAFFPEVTARQPLADVPTVSWQGAPQTIYQPPDPDLAVGPEDVIQVLNSVVNRFSRAGDRTDTVVLSEWFRDNFAEICPSGVFNCLLFDPTIRYDQLHGRFIMTLMAVDFTAQRSNLLISVSKGATYASGWKNWVLNAKLDGPVMTSNWADYPMFGFDNQGVYLSANMFSFATAQFQYAKVRLLKKSDLYNVATTVLPFQDIVHPRHEDGSTASTLMAPHYRGRVGLSAGPILIAGSDVVSPDYLTLFRINNPFGATPTLSRTTIKGVWKYDYPGPIPQLGTTVTLGSGDSRILKAVLREKILFTARGTRYSDEPVTATWDRIDVPSGKVTLQARMVNGNFFFPTFDIPATLGVANIFPKLIAGTTSSPTGALIYPGVLDMKAGESYYDQVSGGSSARWGDYFGAAIDPIQGGMWVTGQYAKARSAGTSVYGTWVSYFPWGSLQEFNDVSSSRSSFHHINSMRIWGITNGCASPGGPNYCPDIHIAREQMATFVIRSMFGDDFPFPPIPYYSDVPATNIFFKYIQKAKELGIVNDCGTEPIKFCPADPMTRETTALFIVRAKMKSLFGEAFAHPATPYFTDVKATDPYFAYVQKLRELGITAGCTATEYCPKAFLTREQMAVFVVRAFLN